MKWLVDIRFWHLQLVRGCEVFEPPVVNYGPSAVDTTQSFPVGKVQTMEDLKMCKTSFAEAFELHQWHQVLAIPAENSSLKVHFLAGWSRGLMHSTFLQKTNPHPISIHIFGRVDIEYWHVHVVQVAPRSSGLFGSRKPQKCNSHPLHRVSSGSRDRKFLEFDFSNHHWSLYHKVS